jgi:hypothetical protein
MEFSMNSMGKLHEKIRQMFLWNSMEFHETEVDGMEFHGKFHGIP